MMRQQWGRLWIGGIGYLPLAQALDVFPNASKTWLVTKEGLHEAPVSIFANTGVNVTPSGRPYLGAAIGFCEYVAGKVESKGQRVDIYHTMSCNYSRNPTPCCLLCPNT